MDMVLPGEWLDIASRLGLAVLLGGLLGLDRELRHHAAGLRTHMLVALGAATTTVMALSLYDRLLLDNPQINADPLRAIEGVIAAIGFIGAGAIIQGQSAGRVHGLTTAANIWICGAIGLAAGAGHHMVAIACFLFALFILSILGLIERQLKSRAAQEAEDEKSRRERPPG